MDCSCEDFRQIVREEIQALLQNMPQGKARAKRKPSEYNIFIGQCMKSGKDMKGCATDYKKQKGLGGSV